MNIETYEHRNVLAVASGSIVHPLGTSFTFRAVAYKNIAFCSLVAPQVYYSTLDFVSICTG